MQKSLLTNYNVAFVVLLQANVMVMGNDFRSKRIKSLLLQANVMVTRPGIKLSKPSGPSAQAQLSLIGAWFSLLGGTSLLLALGLVQLSIWHWRSSLVQLNRTEQRGCLRLAEHARCCEAHTAKYATAYPWLLIG